MNTKLRFYFHTLLAMPYADVFVTAKARLASMIGI